MPRDLKSFEDLINDRVVKTTGTLFTTYKGNLYCAKFDSDDKIYPAVYKDGKLEYDKSLNMYTTISSFALAMIKRTNDRIGTVSGMEACYYSDNEEYYDSIVLKNLRKAAYEKVITPSSL